MTQWCYGLKCLLSVGLSVRVAVAIPKVQTEPFCYYTVMYFCWPKVLREAYTIPQRYRVGLPQYFWPTKVHDCKSRNGYKYSYFDSGWRPINEQ